MNRPTRSLCLAARRARARRARRRSPASTSASTRISPPKTLPALQKKAGKNVKTVSTYLTVGHALDPEARHAGAQERRQARSSAGCPTRARTPPKAPGYRLSAIAAGKFDPRPARARRADQGAAARRDRAPDARPEHALVRLVGHRQRQPPRRLRARLEARAQGADEGRGQEGQADLERVRAQRARRPRRTRSRCTSRAPSRSTWSAPTPTTSARPRASPGRRPPTSSRPPTATIQKLAKKPFWISETGSTARGGDEGAWIGALGQLGKTMPKLAGVVWYDVKDSTGDFRVPRTGAAAAAFKAFVRGACK